MSFVQRAISATIDLGTGDYGDGKPTKVTLSGLRASVQMQNAGRPGMARLLYRVYGLPLSLMNQILSLGMPLTYGRQNTITVQAGDKGGQMPVIFQGIIQTALPDFNAQPDVALTVTASPGYIDQLKPVTPLSYSGPTDAVVIMRSIAASMGRPFENDGVNPIMLSNPYLPGNATEQADKVAEAAGIKWTIDPATSAFAIWPKGGSRTGAAVDISPQTGMVGYPSWTSGGINVTTIFNPNVSLAVKAKISSSIPAANGMYTIYAVEHDLQSETPGGSWFTQISCYTTAQAATMGAKTAA